MNMHIPRPVWVDSRVSFSIAYFARESDAVWYAEAVRSRGDAHNGGWRNGEACGRAPEYDRNGLYAVTQR